MGDVAFFCMFRCAYELVLDVRVVCEEGMLIFNPFGICCLSLQEDTKKKCDFALVRGILRSSCNV